MFFSNTPTMRLSCCLAVALVLTVALPTTASRWLKKEMELPVRCVDKGSVVDNSGYDDDTVVCDEETGLYDLQYLDPKQAPLRCELWNPTQTNLEVLHPWSICVQWHMLYGALSSYPPSVAPETEPPTLAPTSTPTFATSPPTSATTSSPTSAPTQSHATAAVTPPTPPSTFSCL
jgi:hypothetical protein